MQSLALGIGAGLVGYYLYNNYLKPSVAAVATEVKSYYAGPGFYLQPEHKARVKMFCDIKACHHLPDVEQGSACLKAAKAAYKAGFPYPVVHLCSTSAECKAKYGPIKQWYTCEGLAHWPY